MDAVFGARTLQSSCARLFFVLYLKEIWSGLYTIHMSDNYSFRNDFLDSQLNYSLDFSSLYPLLSSIVHPPPQAPPDLPPPSPQDAEAALAALQVPVHWLAPLPSPDDPFSSPSLSVLPSPVASTSVGSPPGLGPLFSPLATTIQSVSLSPPQIKREHSLIAMSEAEEDGSPARKRRTLAASTSPPQIVWRVELPPVATRVAVPPPPSRSRIRPYDACRCPERSQKPARHWRTACPYNPAKPAPVTCGIDGCEETFNRRDNMERHRHDFH